MGLNLHQVQLKISAVRPNQFQKGLPEVIFCGRSNVGKSSMINCLLARKSLARTSEKPGKTATINYYEIDHKLFLVDLPGYGYAKVSYAEKERWSRFMEAYFNFDGDKRLAFSLVDLRHAPTAADLDMAVYLEQAGIPYWIVATKADKLSKTAASENLEKLQEYYQDLHPQKILAFSSKTRMGRDELLEGMEKACGGEKNA
ncbi:MAG: YihA family ribosome biogenesis GTP-binding protein [Clostridia bacterium]|nr:YihA family ribosome biogenesis GTP-binding protein [Clostridia bacterium]